MIFAERGSRSQCKCRTNVRGTIPQMCLPTSAIDLRRKQCHMSMTMPSPRTQFRTSTDLDEIVRCSELIHQCGMHALPFAFEHAASPVPFAVFAAVPCRPQEKVGKVAAKTTGDFRRGGEQGHADSSPLRPRSATTGTPAASPTSTTGGITMPRHGRPTHRRPRRVQKHAAAS